MMAGSSTWVFVWRGNLISEALLGIDVPLGLALAVDHVIE
jgi:hypothetical protein